jgi:hypothetical protein
MRGAKRDNTETMARNFMDDRSFVSMDGHDYLYGDDIGDRRREVWERAHGYCEVKQAPGCSGLVSWVDGEMHHKQGGLVGRNDDMENLLWSCMACHRYEHRNRNPRFSQREPVESGEAQLIPVEYPAAPTNLSKEAGDVYSGETNKK